MASSSRRTLTDSPSPAPELPLDRSGDALRDREAPEHPPHKAGRYALLAGNLAEIRPVPDLGPESDQFRARLELQIGTSAIELPYAERDNSVKSNIPSRISSRESVPAAQAVFQLRKSLGYTQQQLANALGVIQTRVAKWESGKLAPPGPVCASLARLAPEGEKEYWLSLAGLSMRQQISDYSEARLIPLLRDAAAAGTPRAIDDREIQEMISFPRHWLPPGGSIVAIKVDGDSMSPTLEDGDIAFVNVASRNVDKLIDKMIAAREGEGVTIKWLRRDASTLMLVPQHSSPRHPVRVWRASDDRGIVGEIVGWYGRPPNLHGKRK